MHVQSLTDAAQNISTGRTNTFLHLHNDTVRPRDMLYDAVQKKAAFSRDKCVRVCIDCFACVTVPSVTGLSTSRHHINGNKVQYIGVRRRQFAPMNVHLAADPSIPAD